MQFTARSGRNRTIAMLGVLSLLIFCGPMRGESPAENPATHAAQRTFTVRGTVKDLKPEEYTLTVAHEIIANYMDAMTMPFKVKDPGVLTPLQKGDRISFQLHVSDTESWIDQIQIEKRGPDGRESDASRSERSGNGTANVRQAGPPELRSEHPLMTYLFTNELGRAVSLGEFKGQALGITFFFTRCPIPDFCPRLSKNFEEASRKLGALPNAPTNWHFLSVSFDPAFDTPSRLKAYGEQYNYDPAHWSFLIGPADKIHALAAQADVQFESDGAFISHNFRTLIVDALGHLQMVFPTSGDLSDQIVTEILKAARAGGETPGNSVALGLAREQITSSSGHQAEGQK
jgi:protein SCO1